MLFRNIELLEEQKQILQKKNLIINYNYKKEINISLQDSSILNQENKSMYDLLVSSPPYGDNHTTVPYGQYSYLPLQWIDLRDIDKSLDIDILRSTCEIDTRSLGGSLANIQESEYSLKQMSKSYKSYSKKLSGNKHLNKVTAFIRDIHVSLKSILTSLKPNSYMIWTLGNRRVANQLVPFDQIIQELLESQGCCLVEKILREIPAKKMALKNNYSETMNCETILIMRKKK